MFQTVMNAILNFNLAAPGLQDYQQLASSILGAIPMISTYKSYLVGNETSILKIFGMNLTAL
jgi:hypothetical protein